MLHHEGDAASDSKPECSQSSPLTAAANGNTKATAECSVLLAERKQNLGWCYFHTLQGLREM